VSACGASPSTCGTARPVVLDSAAGVVLAGCDSGLLEHVAARLEAERTMPPACCGGHATSGQRRRRALLARRT